MTTGSESKASLSSFSLGQSFFPIRFLGMGVYLAWLYSAHYGMTLFPQSTDGSELSLSFFVSNAINAICLIGCALLAKKIAPLAKRPSTLWYSALSATTGTLLTAAQSMLPIPSLITVIIGSMLTGSAIAFLILLWSEFYSSLPIRRVSLYYSASFILATAINYFVAFMTPLFAIVFTSALPAVSVIMLKKSMEILPDSPDESSPPMDTRWSFPFRPVILMAIYSFAFNYIRQSDGGTTEFGMLGVGAIALLVFVANLFFFDRFDIRILYRITLPLMVVALLIQPLFGSEGIVIADILANSSYAGFVIFTMIILSSICFRYGVVAIWLFGLTRAARVLANIFGACVGKATINFDPFTSSVFLGVIVVVLVAVSMFLLSDKDFRSAWGIISYTENGSMSAANYYDTFLGRCAQVAREYGLTHREEEVLSLLAEGKSVPRIEQDLVISNGTAKSHVRHIYSKLNIHSRDELIQIVGMRHLPK